LGIESSFDDSCAAIVRGDGEVLSSKIKRFEGGLVKENAPIRAADHHMNSLPFLVEDALEESKLSMDQLKAIAVTMGPG